MRCEMRTCFWNQWILTAWEATAHILQHSLTWQRKVMTCPYHTQATAWSHTYRAEILFCCNTPKNSKPEVFFFLIKKSHASVTLTFFFKLKHSFPAWTILCWVRLQVSRSHLRWQGAPCSLMGSGKNIPQSCHWLRTAETQATVWPGLLASFNRKEACSSINSANTIRWYLDFQILSVTGNLLETQVHNKNLIKSKIIKIKQQRGDGKLQHLNKA